jgi:hypothetical protein
MASRSGLSNTQLTAPAFQFYRKPNGDGRFWFHPESAGGTQRQSPVLKSRPGISESQAIAKPLRNHHLGGRIAIALDRMMQGAFSGQ